MKQCWPGTGRPPEAMAQGTQEWVRKTRLACTLEDIKAALVKAQDKGVDALTEPEHQGGCGRAEGVDALRKTMLTFKLEEIKAALVKAKDTVSSASGSGESEYCSEIDSERGSLSSFHGDHFAYLMIVWQG